jgi:uncharacterized cupredoxin-like copper-binding protein
VVAVVLAGIALQRSGDTSADDLGGSQTPAGAVSATEADFHIALSATELSAGDTTFEITNSANQNHEFVVFATDLDPANFPKSPDGNVDEEGPGLKDVSDGDDIPAGGHQTRKVNLPPGRYVAVCNLPGHFAAGMHTVITVK